MFTVGSPAPGRRFLFYLAEVRPPDERRVPVRAGGGGSAGALPQARISPEGDLSPDHVRTGADSQELPAAWLISEFSTSLFSSGGGAGGRRLIDSGPWMNVRAWAHGLYALPASSWGMFANLRPVAAWGECPD